MKSQGTDWIFLTFVFVALLVGVFAIYKLVDIVLYEIKLRDRRKGKNSLEIRANTSRIRWMRAK